MAVFLSPDRTMSLGVVADGLGGHGAGDVASGIVIKVAAVLWEELAGRGISGPDFLSELIIRSNEFILRQQQRQGNDARTTVCCVMARGPEVDIASVGDSRAYLLSPGRGMERLTRDHSVTEMLLVSGEIDEDGMRSHPDSSRLTQSLGSSEKITPFKLTSKLVKPGEAILLCSDGLWQAAPKSELFSMLTQGEGPTRMEAITRTAAALSGPESDNVSAVFMERDPGFRENFLQGLSRRVGGRFRMTRDQ